MAQSGFIKRSKLKKPGHKNFGSWLGLTRRERIAIPTLVGEATAAEMMRRNNKTRLAFQSGLSGKTSRLSISAVAEPVVVAVGLSSPGWQSCSVPCLGWLAESLRFR
jgi:hypothetical protein